MEHTILAFLVDRLLKFGQLLAVEVRIKTRGIGPGRSIVDDSLATYQTCKLSWPLIRAQRLFKPAHRDWTTIFFGCSRMSSIFHHQLPSILKMGFGSLPFTKKCPESSFASIHFLETSLMQIVSNYFSANLQFPVNVQGRYNSSDAPSPLLQEQRY